MADEVADFAAMWALLTPTQKRFVVAMQEHPTKKAAAEAIDIHPGTAYNWNGEVDAVINFIRDNTALAMLGIYQNHGSKAAMVVGKLLDSPDEAVRLRAAQDIIDRNLGKATQRNEHSGPNGSALQILVQVESENG